MTDSPDPPLGWATLVRQRRPNAVPVMDLESNTPARSPRKYLVNPQKDSKLMTIPQEMRDKILAHLFESTRLTWGVNHGTKLMSPNKNNELAILQTCRAMHAQAGDKWIGQVTMNFVTPEAAIFKLGHVTVEVRQKIRRLQMPGSTIGLNVLLFCRPDRPFYRPHTPLSRSDTPFLYRPDASYVSGMLPGLSLDKLTIFNLRSGNLELLDWIVKKGDGWKECHYLAKTPQFLAEKVRHDQAVDMSLSEGPPDRSIFKVQLEYWQEILENRDGACSQPSIKLYLARRAYRASSFVPSCLATPENEFDLIKGEVMDPADISKQVLVVIRRGKGAKLTLKGTKTLHEIKNEVRLTKDPLGKGSRSVISTRIDGYSHPEELLWNQDMPGHL